MVVGESRTELLQWLNTLLDLQYTKVENCGSGAAYCQLMDCIFGGIPLQKVKFNTTNEYDYRNNMKILQASFNKNGITKSIDTERLIKCRLQDNLELLQWFKKTWTDRKDVNDGYDARHMRNDDRPRIPKVSTARPTTRRVSDRQVSSERSSATTSRQVSSSGSANSGTITKLNKELEDSNNQIHNLQEELQEYKVLVDSLETERNFYFNKLREIEILTQNILDNNDESSEFQSDLNSQISKLSVVDFTKQIQSILYTTEEGFDDNGDNIDAESF